VLVTLVAIALVDRLGRKPLLVVGSAGMAVTLALMWCFARPAFRAQLNLSGPGALPPGAAMPVVFFGMSWGPMV
jgi:hypothetical protein